MKIATPPCSLRWIPVFVFLLLAVAWTGSARAQNVIATVAPNIGGSDNSVDILNNSGGNWYFYSNPTPSAARMALVDSSKISVTPWGTVGGFYADPSQSQNRIFPGQYLRVYPKTLAVNSVIGVEFAYGPSGTRYQFQITVMSGQQVTSMPILDPSPTTASQVRWRVNFTAPISGVTAANFSFTNSANIASLSIASVTPDTAQPSASWTVTANTGSGLGLLGLNWVGHVTESPSVPNSFSGNSYDFSFLPTIDADPQSVGINRNTTTTLTIAASLRTGGAPNYQWYSGTAANLSAATVISGATSSTYTPPVFSNLGAFSYFCRVFTHPNNYRDSAAAIVTVVDPPSITSQPASAWIATGQTRTLTVAASGTNLVYQWYRGNAPSTANPVGSGTASYTTPALTANTNYWVRISNAGPTVVNSSTATVGVVSSLTLASIYTTTVNTAFGTALGVTARDSANAPVSGIPITFTAPSGGVASGRFPAAALTATVNTNASGEAFAPQFTANTVAGGFNTVANFNTLSTNLTCTNLPGAPSALALAIAPPATAVAGTPFSPQPVVQLRDAFNNLCTDNNSAVLTASRVGGTGTLQGTLSATASGGVFSFTNLNHTVAGVITAGFTSGALTLTSGNITILPAAPATLTLSGGGQTTAPNQAFTTALAGTVTDTFANPVPGTTVQFTAPSAGASGTFSTGTATFSAPTDASGNVSTPLTANGLSGSWQVTATATGIAAPGLLSFKNETAADAWRQANFSTILSTGTASDYASPHGDTVPNLHKFAFNLSATGPDNSSLTPTGTAGLPALLRTPSGGFELYYLRRKASTIPGLAWIPERSANLASYAALDLSAATITSIDSTWERVKVPVSSATGGFLRVRVPYLRDFNQGLGSATLRGTAALNAGAVRLTNSLGGQLGAVVLENIPNPATPSGFTVNFNVTMTGPAIGIPADGMSLAVGALPATAWGEAGPPGPNLTVGIDTYNNGPIPDAPGVHVWANGVHLAHAAFTPNTTGTVIPVEVSYDAATGVTVKYNGTAVLTNIAVPGFIFNTTSQYGFGGRTGGAVQTTVVDDILISPR